MGTMGTMTEFAEKYQIQMQATPMSWDWAMACDGTAGATEADLKWGREAAWYDVALYNNRTHRETVLPPYGMGPGNADPPTVAGVLSTWAGLAADVEAAEGFEMWAEGWGMNPDSRAAERRYLRQKLVAADLRWLLGGAYTELLYETEKE